MHSVFGICTDEIIKEQLQCNPKVFDKRTKSEASFCFIFAARIGWLRSSVSSNYVSSSLLYFMERTRIRQISLFYTSSDQTWSDMFRVCLYFSLVYLQYLVFSF